MVVISNVFVVFTLFAMLCGMMKQLLMQYYEPISSALFTGIEHFKG